MRKTLILFLTITSLFVLVACSNTNTDDPITETEPTTGPTTVETEIATVTTTPSEIGSTTDVLEFSVHIISDEELELLEGYIKINYAQTRATSTDHGHNLIFRFNQPISNFSLLDTDIDMSVLPYGAHAVADIFFELEEVAANTPIVLTDYFLPKMDPRNGFHFVDSDGNEHWYVFGFDHAHQTDPTYNIWMESFSWSRDYGFYARTPDDIHIVQAGDTLFSISQLRNISVEVLQQANNMDTSTDLQIGRWLQIPPEGSELLQEINIKISMIDDNLISELEYDLIAYLNNFAGWHFLFETSNTLYDLRIVTLILCVRPREVGFTHKYLGDFNIAGESSAFLIKNYVEGGTGVAKALRFYDSYGVERTFQIGWSPQNIDGEWVDIWGVTDITHFTN